jgi:hypothetical protein
MVITNQAKFDDIKECAILDFIVAHDREPRDEQELVDWCRQVLLARLFDRS